MVSVCVIMFQDFDEMMYDGIYVFALQVLLALERIEQDEEMTHEVLLNSFFLSISSLHNQVFCYKSSLSSHSKYLPWRRVYS